MKLVLAVLLVLLAGLAVNAAPRGRQVSSYFLPRDASAERGYEIAFVCPSVCPSVCDVQVSGTHRLEFFENNFTAE